MKKVKKVKFSILINCRNFKDYTQSKDQKLTSLNIWFSARLELHVLCCVVLSSSSSSSKVSITLKNRVRVEDSPEQTFKEPKMQIANF